MSTYNCECKHFIFQIKVTSVSINLIPNVDVKNKDLTDKMTYSDTQVSIPTSYIVYI